MLVGLLKKKSWPTDPNFEDHSIENTHIIFGLTWKKHDPRELSLLKKKTSILKFILCKNPNWLEPSRRLSSVCN
jgi:hypothetical protein